MFLSSIYDQIFSLYNHQCCIIVIHMRSIPSYFKATVSGNSLPLKYMFCRPYHAPPVIYTGDSPICHTPSIIDTIISLLDQATSFADTLLLRDKLRRTRQLTLRSESYSPLWKSSSSNYVSHNASVRHGLVSTSTVPPFSFIRSLATMVADVAPGC